MKAEVDLQHICILQFPQSSEEQSQLCLASPVAEILEATGKFLLDILKVGEITVWASSRAAAGRAGILWRDDIEQPCVLKGSKRKLRLDQIIYGLFLEEEGGETFEKLQSTRQKNHQLQKKFILATNTFCPLFILLWTKDYILSGVDSCCEMLLPEAHRLTKWNIHLPLIITQ